MLWFDSGGVCSTGVTGAAHHLLGVVEANSYNFGAGASTLAEVISATGV